LQDSDLIFKKTQCLLQKQQQLKSVFVFIWRKKKSVVHFTFTVA